MARNAAAALCNVSYQSATNQNRVRELGGISALLSICQAALEREEQEKKEDAEFIMAKEGGIAAENSVTRHRWRYMGSIWTRRKDYVRTILGRPDLTALGGQPSVLDTEVGLEGKPSGLMASFTSQPEPGIDVDVLENVTAALSTLTAQNTENAVRFIDQGGVEIFMNLVSEHEMAAEGEIVHANIAETLANVSQYQSKNAGMRLFVVWPRCGLSLALYVSLTAGVSAASGIFACVISMAIAP